MRAQIDQGVELLIALRTLVGCLVGRVYSLVDVAFLECSHLGLTVAALEIQLGRMNGWCISNALLDKKLRSH